MPLKVKNYPKLELHNDHIDAGIYMTVRPETGLADPKWKRQKARAFARSDRQDFTTALFWQLYDYIYTLMDYYGDQGGAQRAMRKMNPRDFAVYTGQSAQIADDYQK